MMKDMSRFIIHNAQVICPDRSVPQTSVIIAGDTIKEIVPADSVVITEQDKVLDAGGKYLAPGFIDIHTHGGGGHDFMDGTVEAYLGAAETHAKYGTTALLPTTLTSTTEELLASLEIYKKANQQNTKGAKFLGFHLEGPYFAYNQRGAQDRRAKANSLYHL